MKASATPLTQKIKDKPIKVFVGNWEMLEELITAIYRSGEATPKDLDLFISLQYALRSHYKKWASALRPYWQQIKVAGRPNKKDPFQTLIDASMQTDKTDYWDMMQSLPVAREALNQMVLDAIKNED